MQMLLVAGLNIVLFTNKHTVTNIMSADEQLLSLILVPRIYLCAFSSRPFIGEATKEFTTNYSGNRDSEQPRRYEHTTKN